MTGRAAGAPTLSRERFEAFVEAMSHARVALKGRVVWEATADDPEDDGEGEEDGAGPSLSHLQQQPPPQQQQRGIHDSEHEIAELLDMTPPPGRDGTPGRRQFVQILADKRAGPEQVWHLEVRWLVCQAHRVEELVKSWTRRARQAGLLMLQVPTGRRPRPFSPSVLVPLPTPMRAAAVARLRDELGFVRQGVVAMQLGGRTSTSSVIRGEQLLHELGVAYVRYDPQGRGLLWSANRLQPSQAARAHSQRLLDDFRAICEGLEMAPRHAEASAPGPPGSPVPGGDEPQPAGAAAVVA